MKHKCYKRIPSKTCSFPCLKVPEMWQVYAPPKNKKVNNKDYILYNNRKSLQISHCWFLSVKFTSSESSSLYDWKCTCHRHTHPFWENRVQQLPLLYPLRTEVFLQSAPRKQGGKSKLQRKVGLSKLSSSTGPGKTPTGRWLTATVQRVKNGRCKQHEELHLPRHLDEELLQQNLWRMKVGTEYQKPFESEGTFGVTRPNSLLVVDLIR